MDTANTYTIEVYVACDNNGDYATSNTAEDAIAQYNEQIGATDTVIRVTRLEIDVEFPPIPTHKLKLKMG